MEQRNKWLFGAILMGTCLILLALNLLTPMIADDYRYAFRFDNGQRVQSLWDIFPSLAAHARTLNGRLTPHFLVQLLILLPRPVFAVLNTGVYLALLLGMYRLVRQGGRRWDWPLLLAVDGALFLLPPAFGQSFLWLSGSCNYLWCDALMVWLLLPFARQTFGRQPQFSWRRQALLMAGALWMGNMSENVSAAAILMMGLCVLWQWVHRRKAPLWMYLTILAAAAGWLLLMLSPANLGNVGSSIPGLHGLFERYRRLLALWIQHLMAPSLAFLLLFALGWNISGGDRERLWFALGLAGCSLAATLALVASDYHPERALTGSMILMILACALALGSVAEAPWQKVLRMALAMGFALVMGLQAVSALPSAYNRYRQAQARIADVVEQRDAGTMDVVTFGILGLSRFDGFDGLHELTDQKEYFPNVYFAKYYGIRSVVTDRYE